MCKNAVKCEITGKGEKGGVFALVGKMENIEMIKRKDTIKNVVCAMVLLCVAAASFCAMYLFDRKVFANELQFIICFYVLAICLIVGAALRQPVVLLAVALAALAALWRYTPLYGALFFPVSLQAVLYDTASGKKTREAAVYYVSVVLSVASVGLRISAAVKEAQWHDHPWETDPPAEKYVWLLILIGLVVLYGRMFAGGFRAVSAKEKKRRKTPSAEAVGDRLHTVHLFCIVNTLGAGAHCAVCFNSDCVKVIVLGQLLFLPFLLFRKDDLGFRFLRRIIDD